MLSSTVSIFAADLNDSVIDRVAIRDKRKIAKRDIEGRDSEPNSSIVCRYLGAAVVGAVMGIGYSKGVDSLPSNILEPQNPWVMGFVGAGGVAFLYGYVKQQEKQLKIDQRALELLSIDSFRLRREKAEIEQKLQESENELGRLRNTPRGQKSVCVIL